MTDDNQDKTRVYQILATLDATEAKWIAFSDHAVAVRLRWLSSELYVVPHDAELAREFAELIVLVRETQLWRE